MSRKTNSETLFEQFCNSNALPLSRIQEGESPSPDYCVRLGVLDVYFEIKQIDKDTEFSAVSSSRTIGSHVRAKIKEARNQVRTAAKLGAPAVLLIYNNLDPLQRFGTEQLDFVAAMYGEPTVLLSNESGQIVDSFHGKNKALRENKNNSFSSVGVLRVEPAGTVSVHVYENIYAQVPLPYETLPSCITFNRMEVK